MSIWAHETNLRTSKRCYFWVALQVTVHVSSLHTYKLTAVISIPFLCFVRHAASLFHPWCCLEPCCMSICPCVCILWHPTTLLPAPFPFVSTCLTCLVAQPCLVHHYALDLKKFRLVCWCHYQSESVAQLHASNIIHPWLSIQMVSR